MNPIFILLIFSLFSCKKNKSPSAEQSDRQVYFNGKIYTVNEEQPWAEAMLVEKGVITLIGSNREVQKKASEEAKIIDLQNHMVLPGIHDVHLHPLEAGSKNFQFILDETETDPENYAYDVEKAIQQHPEAEWILGWGFDIHTLLGAKRPPVEILDELSLTKPIAIMELTSHSIWCNSKALELAGITTSSPNPPGGIIMREANGEPNGLLIDNAGNLLIDLAIVSIPGNAEKDYEGLVNFGLPELAKNGITSLCDARTYWKRNHHRTWQKIADEGKLTARVNLGLWAYPDEDDAFQINRLKELYNEKENSLLKINQIKLYSDGIIINTTSAMQEDYKIDLFGLPTNNGLNYFTQERIAKYIAALESTGFDFHIHTIGDRGVKEALNAIEQSGSAKGRHRLTHVEFVDPADYNRFYQLNVTADCQVAGDFTQPDHWHDNDEFIVPSLAGNVIPIRSLHEAKARVTLSSDWDVSTLSPFAGLQNAVTRTPQALSLAEALKAYTLNSAYVMRQEAKVGSLEVGKEADFIVLDRNLFEIPPHQIGKTQVLATYLQGELIFER
ncbi:amidohydrolase [Rapidithrix thailandica]|uniref:Amidohydrolase n=1 Tax=Rapidithrix thailandica TaxID=413964 RepID=A0AAW9SLR8_9BACT